MHPLQRFLLERFLRTAQRLVTGLEIGLILDCGSAEGFVLDYLVRDSTGAGLGIDIDLAALDRGRRLHPALPLLPGNALRAPFQDNRFDLVLCTEVLEHVSQPEVLLAEVHRLTRKYVLLSVPDEPYFRAGNLLRGKHVRRLGNDPEHLFNWTAGEFVGLVREHFEILEIRRPFPWTMVLARKAVPSIEAVPE